MAHSAPQTGEPALPGTNDDEVDPKVVRGIAARLSSPKSDKHGRAHGALIAILEEVQAEYGYLPEKALRTVSESTGRSLVDIYAVATFYRSFSLEPRGKHLVSACVGTACHVRGSAAVVEEFERRLGIKAGETTPDREFTLETVNCLGACALGPIVVADGRYFSKVSPAGAEGILARVREGFDKADVTGDERVFPLDVVCPLCGAGLMDPEHLVDGRPSVRLTARLSSPKSVPLEGMRRAVWLSCLYGSHAVECEAEIPSGTVVDLLCPHCEEGLAGAPECLECGAPMAAMDVGGGGTARVCARRGCRGHMLDV